MMSHGCDPSPSQGEVVVHGEADPTSAVDDTFIDPADRVGFTPGLARLSVGIGPQDLIADLEQALEAA
jgi:cystathionine beta-lyase/cystathionine gamma-synthase